MPGGTITGPFVWDAESAARIPGVSRATYLYTTLIKQCPLDAWRGIDPLPRPRLLDRPDPTAARSWFVQLQVEDYLWHGNALSMTTGRNAEGWPTQVMWIPAGRTTMTWLPGELPRYWYGGRELPSADITHVRRSADRWFPVRGVGVIEQHLATFDRVGMEEEYERNSLSGAGVPSVAVTTPNPNLSQGEADDAHARWQEKFYGPVREPVFLPAGTVITPLGWSPSDSQMTEARRMSLTDVANAFNLDGFWLGADSKGLTYKSPGPMYLSLVRTSLEGPMVDLEQTWADAWLPRGQAVRFDRLQLTRDDFASNVETLTKAITPPTVPAGADPIEALLSRGEARTYLGVAAAPGAVSTLSPAATTEEQ